MSKGKSTKKGEMKKPAKTLKEKQAFKRDKKNESSNSGLDLTKTPVKR